MFQVISEKIFKKSTNQNALVIGSKIKAPLTENAPVGILGIQFGNMLC